MFDNNTICAIATAPGGAIGIIRISGDNSIDIADSIFSPIGNQTKLSYRKPYTLAFGNIIDDEGNVVDEVLVSVFHAPHSYTGENSVEISCHGSPYILQLILRLLISHGCRSAEPGEFTRRAFMNGKMDLSQAEAVADLISSSNRATHKIAMSQLKGHFSSELGKLREQLLHMTSLLELELDFSDHEELEFADRSELLTLATKIKKRVTILIKSFETGIALKQGIPVAIVGNTNVGKSTLLNRLLHEEKAIVSDIHGTTRDFIEDTTIIKGITFRFIDTAGIRATDDVVENIGIERTYKKLEEARIVLWLIDKEPVSEEIKNMQEHCKEKHLIIVWNKIDIKSQPKINVNNKFKIIGISAKEGVNISRLTDAIVDSAGLQDISENDVVVTSSRHYEALIHASESLDRVIEAIGLGLSSDLIAEDLNITLDSLADITGGGRITSQDTLNNIFKHFCIGK